MMFLNTIIIDPLIYFVLAIAIHMQQLFYQTEVQLFYRLQCLVTKKNYQKQPMTFSMSMIQLRLLPYEGYLLMVLDFVSYFLQRHCSTKMSHLNCLNPILVQKFASNHLSYLYFLKTIIRLQLIAQMTNLPSLQFLYVFQTTEIASS